MRMSLKVRKQEKGGTVMVIDHGDDDTYIRVEVGGKVLLKCAVENLGER